MSARKTAGGGFGNVGLGDPGDPSPTVTRPDLCAEQGHPGATYNVALDMTFCLCGAVITDGDTSVPHVACCGGPLVSARPEVA